MASLVLVMAPQLSGHAAAATTGPVTYQDHVYAASATEPPSADKPQSKLWFNDGAWWAAMLGSSSVNIYQLGLDHIWHDTGTVVDPRVNSTADVLWTGTKLYVASRTGGATGRINVYRFSYSATTRHYSRDAGFPVNVGGVGGSESVTIDRDTVGRLWLTFTRASGVWVAQSGKNADATWAAPFQIPGIDGAVDPDDISSLISMGGKIGVFWSDQAAGVDRFAVHKDTSTPLTGWSFETPFSGTRIADDHMNLKSLLGDDQGRVYAAVKTSLGDVATDPLNAPGIVVLTRSSTGVWTRATASYQSLAMTRPQLALDSTHRQLILMDADQSGGSVHYKTAPLGAVTNASFDPASRGAVFMSWPGAVINDVSTSKDPVNSTTGLVAIATDSVSVPGRYYHAELTLPPGATVPPPGTVPPGTVPPGTVPPGTVPPGTVPPTPGPPISASPRPVTRLVTCEGLKATIIGTARADRLVGTRGNDVIVALAGSDSIQGRGGRDTICAGAGNDSVNGGTGNDRLFGNTGNDAVTGEKGTDAIDGGRGNDRIFGGAGPDLLTGGPGSDAINGGPGADTTHAGGGLDTCTSPRLAAGCNR